jgi:uncharacterized membrane protein
MKKSTDFIEMNRLEGFSDGVFGIAMTLIGFDLKEPEFRASAETLSGALLHMWPSYLALLVSFATVLVMWMNHHAIFKYVRGANAAFSFANGFMLLLVTVVPFSTALIARHLNTPEAGVACAVYSGLFVLINISYNILWWVALKGCKLIKSEIPEEAVRSISVKLALGFPAYVAATLIAFYSPIASLLTCCALWLLWGKMAAEHFVPNVSPTSHPR